MNHKCPGQLRLRQGEERAGHRRAQGPTHTLTALASPFSGPTSLTAQTSHQQLLTPPLHPVGLGWKGKEQNWDCAGVPGTHSQPGYPAYRTSLSICNSTSLSLKYVFHRLSGLGLSGCGEKISR